MAAGLTVGRVELLADGRIVVFSKDSAEDDASEAFSAWQRKHNARSS
jgi:hypothetical protein